MRNAIIIGAFVIATVVFCCVFACTKKDDIATLCFENSISFINYLSAIANIGIFSATLFTALYAVREYDNHKKEHRIKLLGEYNQRYSTDNNIQEVINWMLNVAIVDKDGDIVDADPNRCFCRPEVNTKEMFMRFFEELYIHIENGSIDKKQACELFSYYAIKFDEIKEFRLDITDYKSNKELEDEEKNSEKKNGKSNIYWTCYRKFVNEMKDEWKKLKELDK